MFILELPLSFTIHGVSIIQLKVTMHGKKISVRLCILGLGAFNCFSCMTLHLFLITGDALWLFGEYTRIKNLHTHKKKLGTGIFFLPFKIEGQSVENHSGQNMLKYDCTSGDIFHDLRLFDSKLISEFQSITSWWDEAAKWVQCLFKLLERYFCCLSSCFTSNSVSKRHEFNLRK